MEYPTFYHCLEVPTVVEQANLAICFESKSGEYDVEKYASQKIIHAKNRKRQSRTVAFLAWLFNGGFSEKLVNAIPKGHKGTRNDEAIYKYLVFTTKIASLRF